MIFIKVPCSMSLADTMATEWKVRRNSGVLFVSAIRRFCGKISHMKRSKIFFPLMGAAGILVGACARQIPQAQTGANSPDVLQTANAQNAQAPIRNAADLQRLSATYADLSSRAAPAVVNINSQQVIRGRVFRDPMSEFFGEGGEMREPDQRAQSLGSGVIVDARGIIITNNHVVANATSILVTLTDKRRFTAKLLGTDPASDLAVLKIDSAKTLPVMQWADSDKARVGDIVLAIGSPFNLSSTVTQGIISAKGRRDLGITAIEDFLQTDAAINPGNSGGALVDINGNLVGINSAILSKSGGNQGIGLAIPARLARKISGQIVASGRVTRGWLGIVAEAITDDVAAELKLPDTQGVLVAGVLDNGPVANLDWSRGGGNVLLKLNGVAVDSPGALRGLIADLTPGTKVTLEVWQNGATKIFSATVASRPARPQGI